MKYLTEFKSFLKEQLKKNFFNLPSQFSYILPKTSTIQEVTVNFDALKVFYRGSPNINDLSPLIRYKDSKIELFCSKSLGQSISFSKHILWHTKNSPDYPLQIFEAPESTVDYFKKWSEHLSSFCNTLGTKISSPEELESIFEFINDRAGSPIFS